MKKLISLLSVLVMVIVLSGCGGASADKDSLLKDAAPLTAEDLDKSVENAAFAETLVGNVYTFCGSIGEIEKDHAVVSFLIPAETRFYSAPMFANVYLPTDELAALEKGQQFEFVGKLAEMGTNEVQLAVDGSFEYPTMEFREAAITGDMPEFRFENTGKVVGPNLGLPDLNELYGDNSWSIKHGNSHALETVFFRDDVELMDRLGDEITYSYQWVDGYAIDAYIVE